MGMIVRIWSAIIVAGLMVGLLAAGPSQSRDFDPAERALVSALFGTLQPRSFAEGREFCGYLYRDGAGTLRSTAAYPGDAATCAADFPTHGTPIASWHTHGGFDRDAWNELPSDSDIATDALEGVNGWIATPGGRLWHVDGHARTATLVCGLGCLPQDPSFIPGTDGEIARRYTLNALIDKFEAE